MGTVSRLVLLLVGLFLMLLGLSGQPVGAASIVGRLGQAGLTPHLLALLARSISMLGGLFDGVLAVCVFVWFVHRICDYPLAVHQPNATGLRAVGGVAAGGAYTVTARRGGSR